MRVESGEGGGGVGNSLSSQQTVQSLESARSKTQSTVFLVNMGISKCLVFCFVAWWPGVWSSLY